MFLNTKGFGFKVLGGAEFGGLETDYGDEGFRAGDGVTWMPLCLFQGSGCGCRLGFVVWCLVFGGRSE